MVENVFRILPAVFQVFRKPMQHKSEKTDITVLICIYLHIFSRSEISSQNVYLTPDSFENEIEAMVY